MDCLYNNALKHLKVLGIQPTDVKDMISVSVEQFAKYAYLDPDDPGRNTKPYLQELMLQNQQAKTPNLDRLGATLMSDQETRENIPMLFFNTMCEAHNQWIKNNAESFEQFYKDGNPQRFYPYEYLPRETINAYIPFAKEFADVLHLPFSAEAFVGKYQQIQDEMISHGVYEISNALSDDAQMQLGEMIKSEYHITESPDMDAGMEGEERDGNDGGERDYYNWEDWDEWDDVLDSNPEYWQDEYGPEQEGDGVQEPGNGSEKNGPTDYRRLVEEFFLIDESMDDETIAERTRQAMTVPWGPGKIAGDVAGYDIALMNEKTAHPQAFDDGMPGLIVTINDREVDKKTYLQFIHDHKAEFVKFFNEEYLKELEKLGKTRSGFEKGDTSPVSEQDKDGYNKNERRDKPDEKGDAKEQGGGSKREPDVVDAPYRQFVSREMQKQWDQGDEGNGKRVMRKALNNYTQHDGEWRKITFDLGDDTLVVTRTTALGENNQPYDRYESRIRTPEMEQEKIMPYKTMQRYVDLHSKEFEQAIDNLINDLEKERNNQEPER